MPKGGAKAELHRLQGRGGSECCECKDTVALGVCATCGDVLCKDCKIDHDCTKEVSNVPARAKGRTP